MKKYDSSQSYKYHQDYPRRFIGIVRLGFALKSVWRWLRVQRPLTRLLGYQYKPATTLIEIDLTYLCNLRCNNCNRSSAQAPEASHISLSKISQFVNESIESKRHWERIRLLGGEPTLHPDFLSILDEMERYIAYSPSTLVEVVSNGHGKKVNRMLDQVPTSISIENSEKNNNIQPSFGPFNQAPQDSHWYRFADYRNACSIATSCGIGLTPQGYYPCAVAGGIDRVLGNKSGRINLPSTDDEMRDLMVETCALCGRFHDGHYVPPKLRPPLYEQKISVSWRRIYHTWQQRKSSSINIKNIDQNTSYTQRLKKP
ncbi:radical SAM protein [uncultured Amphritea sp.]|uniref:radical SAM protein n=1 Tax=uncultured Amphritea sp. TaxID=981605 RepID=UPI00261E3075|nr:radical SAM protein [uncultured Amphritea sp.]